MSHASVIDKFVGNDYESDGETTSNRTDRIQYYPRKGVKLALEKVLITGVPGEAYAKIRIKADGEPFGSKLALERAVFRVSKESEKELVAENMEIAPGLLLTEKLTMSDDGKQMEHTLKFSDGSLGTWICKH
jgi:hypothetical protein